MNPRDALAKEFLTALLANPEYVNVGTPNLISMAYEVANAFLAQIRIECPTCFAKPDKDGQLIHVSGCPEGWPA